MPSHPVRIVTDGVSDPVRIVTSGPSIPVRIVTSVPSVPVRIVTSGLSIPVRIVGGSIATAPTFVSAEVGTVSASTVVVTFSGDISAPCGDCALGFTVLVGGVADVVTGCVISGGNTVRLTLTTAVAFGDVVTVSYNSAVGCIMDSTGGADVVTFAAQAVTNNIATPWYRAGGAPAPIAAYQPKGAANLAASYDNLTGNAAYDATPGTAPTFAAATGWTFTAASSQYLKTGVLPTVNYVALVRFGTFGPSQTYLLAVLGGAAGDDFGVYGQGGVFRYNAGGAVVGSALGNNHVVAVIDAQKGYLDGVVDSASANPGLSVLPTQDLYIGARNTGAGTPANYADVEIMAIAIYTDKTNFAVWVPAVSAAMAAL